MATPSPIAPSATGDNLRSAAMCRVLAQNWWAIALRGVFAVLFGVLTFVMPAVTIATLVILFAAYMLVDGVFAIVAGVKAAQRQERWGLLVLEGNVNILAGIVALLLPAITVLVFIYLVAFWSVLTGILMAVTGLRLPGDHGRWLLVLAGIVSVVFGVLIAIMPIAGAVVLTLWLGGYAVVFGAMLLALAVRLRTMRETRPAPPSATAGAPV
jgi:uncharacterized membrane protein HdeD (DUF308 family)